jgi:hypothetical protein
MSDNTTHPQVTLTPEQQEAVDALLRVPKKIQAIKLVRETLGIGLKEAKDMVDRRWAELFPLTPEQKAANAFRAAQDKFGTWYDDASNRLDQLEELFQKHDNLHPACVDGIAIARHALYLSQTGLNQEEKNYGADWILVSMRDAIRAMKCWENVTDPAVLAAMDAVGDATTPLAG